MSSVTKLSYFDKKTSGSFYVLCSLWSYYKKLDQPDRGNDDDKSYTNKCQNRTDCSYGSQIAS